METNKGFLFQSAYLSVPVANFRVKSRKLLLMPNSQISTPHMPVVCTKMSRGLEQVHASSCRKNEQQEAFFLSPWT